MIGKTISHYKIVDKLGEGGMGSVYKAEDTTLQRLVAVKVLTSQLANNEEARERFIREAQAASSMNHSNITTVYELLEEEGEQYIAMEYVEGKTIRDMVESGHVSIRKALDIIIQAAEALEAAHNKGILHRDIKSANIMVSMEGNVKVMDFGLAHLEDKSQLTRTGTTMGTLAYSSPEQLTGALVDRRSEIFSLGVVFYELLTGQLPFRSPAEGELLFEIINKEQDHPSQMRADVPENVGAVITKMLIKKPELRYQSCAELLTDLRAIRNELDTTTVQITTALPTVTFKKNRLAILGIAAIVVIVGAVVAMFSSGRGAHLIPNLVVVSSFENYSGDPSYDQFGRWAVDHIHGGIEQVDFARAVPLEHSLPASRSLLEQSVTGDVTDPIRTLAIGASSAIAISGGFYILDNETIQFQVRIRDIPADRTIEMFDDVAGSLDQKNEVVSELRQRVLASLASRLSPGYEQWAEITTPPRSLEAFNEWSRGLDIYMEDSYSEEAISHFYRALEIDPTYLTARLWAARVHFLIGQNDTLHMAQADSMAQDLAAQRAFMSEQDQLMLDLIQASVEWDWERKLQVAKSGVELAPGTFWTFIAAQSAQWADRPNEALNYFEQIDPDGPIFNFGQGSDKYWNQLINTYVRLEDYPHVLENIARYREISGDSRYYLSTECMALGAIGRLETLLEKVEQDILEGRDARSIYTWGYIGLRWGGYDEEVDIITDLTLDYLSTLPQETQRSNGYRNQKGWFLFSIGEVDEAKRIFEDLVKDNPENLNFKTAHAIMAANMGDTHTVQETLQWLEQFDQSYERGGGFDLRAQIETHLGNLDEAVRLSEIGIQRGAWTVWLRYPMYQPLWDHPGFRELLRPKE